MEIDVDSMNCRRKYCILPATDFAAEFAVGCEIWLHVKDSFGLSMY